MTLHCLLELVILNIQWNTQRVNNRVAEREKEEIERERVDWNLERQNLEKKDFIISVQFIHNLDKM